MSDIKQLAERLSSLETRVAKLEGRSDKTSAQPVAKNRKALSVKEFLLEKQPANDVERTLAVGYYLEKHEGASSFNVDDITRNFQLAKEPTPGNVNDKVNMNIKKGHMTEATEKKNKKKAWIVTNLGEQFVEHGFKLGSQ
jgi:hypothetical protein